RNDAKGTEIGSLGTMNIYFLYPLTSPSMGSARSWRPSLKLAAAANSLCRIGFGILEHKCISMCMGWYLDAWSMPSEAYYSREAPT
uniref:Uncharacterized protein n=1 Tax=Calidris pygmaea TaxID=425635 RepID=A0A8C3JA96_9CHAR